MSKYRNKDRDRLVEIFKALSNPNRLAIFMRLVDCCAPGTHCSAEPDPGTCVGEVSDGLGIVPSTVSHHLKELRRAGLVQTERVGQKAECWVDPETLKLLADFFDVKCVERGEKR
jgi:DNA-binding transcriptional ArsR family regulator